MSRTQYCDVIHAVRLFVCLCKRFLNRHDNFEIASYRFWKTYNWQRIMMMLLKLTMTIPTVTVATPKRQHSHMPHYQARRDKSTKQPSSKL